MAFFTLDPGGERFFIAPGDVQGGVTVRIRKPASFPDLFPAIKHTVLVSLGQELFYNNDGSVNVSNEKPSPDPQKDWRWCHKCQGLFFSGGHELVGACPAGGQHEKGGAGITL